MEDYKIHKIFSELTEKVVKCFQYFRITDIPHKTGLNGKSIKLKGRMHVCSTLSNKYNPDTIYLDLAYCSLSGGFFNGKMWTLLQTAIK